MTSGFTLLSSVQSAYGSRLAITEKAQKTLDLQYYAIHADASTDKLVEEIRKAASRGVRVRILLDDLHSGGENARILQLGFEQNIEFRLFNPIAGSRGSLLPRIIGSLSEFDRIQQRMHNKLYIADNVVGIAGGRNLGDAYFGEDKKSNFVDMDVMAVGPIVQKMSETFDRYWNDSRAYPVKTLMTREEVAALEKNASKPAEAPQKSTDGTPKVEVADQPQTDGSPKPEEPGIWDERPMDLTKVPITWAPAIVLVDAPGKIAAEDGDTDQQETVVDGLLQLLSQAKQDVLIVSPYFVPGDQMMKVFQDLHARGVRIRVLTNSLASNDAPVAHVGYARYRERLLKAGVELFEMRSTQDGPRSAFGSSSFGSSGSSGSSTGESRASLHAKTLIIDGRLWVVGSMNLDLRSQLQNTEVGLLIRSTSLSKEASDVVEKTLGAGAYQVMFTKREDGSTGSDLIWKAPAGAPFKDSTTEPDSSLSLRMLVKILGPFAPDEML